MPLQSRVVPALLLATLLVVGGAAPASAQDGVITGTVTRAATGLPVAAAQIWICSAAGPCGTVVTNGAGVYAISRPPGIYFAYTEIPSSDLVDEIFPDIPCDVGCLTTTAVHTGAPLFVQGNKTTTGIDFELAQGSTISGRMFDASTGAGIAGVAITLWRHTAAGPSFSSGTISNSAGNFAVTGLTAATYFAYTLNSAGYVDSTYGGTPCVVSCQQIRETAPGSPIVVTAGTIVSARDFVLIRGGVIAGRITDATTGAPLTNVGVGALHRGGSAPLDASRTLLTGSGGGLSDATGAYVIRGLATGSYVAYVQPSNLYPGEVFDDVLCPGVCRREAESGVPIAVTTGAKTAGIDFALAPGGSIAGVVSSAATNQPMMNVPVRAFRRVGLDIVEAWSALSGTSGEYRIDGLPAGIYYLQTDTTQALNQTYPGRPCASRCSPSDAALGEAIHVVPGAIMTSKDFLLDPGATVNGTITDGALPINSVTVSAYRQSGGTATLVRSGVALNNGAYSVRGLDPGIYYLLADDDLDRFVTELFGGVHCARCDGSEILGGTAIAIAAGTVINGRDFVLDLASRVRGRVTDATSGVPLAGVTVNVYAAANPAHAVGQATTGSDGNYNVRGLPSATVFASTANAPRHLNEIFDDVACTAGICSQSATISTGLGIAVGGGGVASGMNFVLARRNDVPTAPTGLTATAVGFAVQVTWQAPTGGAPATSYLLEAGVAPGTTAITAATPVTSLFAPGVGRGVYYLRVRGVNAFGIGPASAEFPLVVNPDGSATPLPPTAPVAWTAGSRLTMTWLAPTLGPTPTGYAVEAGTAAGLANLGTLPVTTTSFSFDPVPPGFYFLRARSRVGAQASAPSPEVMIAVGNVPVPPSPPQSLSSSVAGSTVTFTWTAPAIGTPSSYVLEAGSAPGLSNLAVFDTGTTATTFFAPGVPPGAYYVRLRARNAQGPGVASDERLVIVP